MLLRRFSRAAKIEAAAAEFLDVAVEKGMATIAGTRGLPENVSDRLAMETLTAAAVHVARKHGLSGSTEDAVDVIIAALGGLEG